MWHDVRRLHSTKGISQQVTLLSKTVCEEWRWRETSGLWGSVPTPHVEPFWASQLEITVRNLKSWFPTGTNATVAWLFQRISTQQLHQEGNMAKQLTWKWFKLRCPRHQDAYVTCTIPSYCPPLYTCISCPFVNYPIKATCQMWS